MNLNEAQPRQLIIDKQLSQARWNVGQRQVIIETLLTRLAHIAEMPEAYQVGDKFIDYLPRDLDGKPITSVL